MRNKIFELINNLKYFIVQIIFYLTLISSLIFAAEMKVYTSEEWERLRKQRYHDADLVIVGQGMSRTTRIVKTREEANEDGGKSHYTTLINNYWIKTIYTLKGTTSDSMLNVQSDSYTQCTISPPPKFEGIDEKGETLYSTIRRLAYGGTQPNIPTQSMSIIFLQKIDTSFVLTYLANYTKDNLDFYQSIEEKEVPVIKANVRAINSFEDTLAIISDSGYVYQGKWPDDLDACWQLMALHLAKSKQEYLIVPVNANLEIIQFEGDSWRRIGRIQYPNNRVSYEYNLWTTGDIDGDGDDEIITCYDSLVSCYKWNGHDFLRRTAIFRYCVEQVRVGDINNDGNNELVFLGGESLPRELIGYPYNLCIAKWDTLGLHLLWDDSTKLGYRVLNMPDFLLFIADIINVGCNQLLVSLSQSDVSPTVFNLLTWDENKGYLKRTKSFVISDRLILTDEHIMVTPYVSGRLNSFTKHDTTFLSGTLFGMTGGSKHDIFIIKNDSLAQARTVFRPFPAGGYFIDLDGRGIGLLVIWQEPLSTHKKFRFYRF